MTWSGLARAGARTALVAMLGSATVAARQARPPATAGAQISGIVTSAADDTPLTRARVLAQANPPADPHVGLTGADGNYVIANLLAGSYTITVTRSGYLPHRFGQGREIAAPPKILPPARVSGQLVAEDGKPLLNGAMVMSPGDGEGVPMVPPGDPSLLPDGTFSFPAVVPGHYQIRARGQTTPGGHSLFAVLSVEVLGVDLEGIRVTLREGALVAGTLAFETRKGSTPPALPALRVRAPFTDGNSFGDSLTGVVQPDGTFALRGLMRGAHQIVVDGLPEPWALKSVLYRGSDITDREIEITGKEQLRDLRITISDVSAAVSGVVKNARELPVANVAVLIFPSAPFLWTRTSRRMRAGYTDGAGRFQVSGLPPGEYLAVASTTIDESDLGRRSRLEQLQSIGLPFRLDADDARAQVSLKVVNAAGRR